jgi:O-antigen chain-terminating methyltransferase
VVRLVKRLEAGPVGEERAQPAPGSPGQETPAGPGGLPEIEYLAFEDRHRGRREEVKARQAQYVALFHDLPGPVLDLGCGRGEFLELLAQAGVAAWGVDLNQEMVDQVQALGLKAHRAEGSAHLRTLAPASLGGLFLAQVVEHLDLPGLTALLVAAHRALAPGGLILAETINPQSLVTFASAFYLDPTHTRPIHPEAARFLLESAGFKEIRIILANPVPEAARLKPVNSLLPGGRALNENLQRLNDLLFGPQDYAVTGRR